MCGLNPHVYPEASLLVWMMLFFLLLPAIIGTATAEVAQSLTKVISAGLLKDFSPHDNRDEKGDSAGFTIDILKSCNYN